MVWMVLLAGIARTMLRWVPFVATPFVVIALGGTGVYSLTVYGTTVRGTPAEFIVWLLSVITPVVLVATAYLLALDYARTRRVGREIDQLIAWKQRRFPFHPRPADDPEAGEDVPRELVVFESETTGGLPPHSGFDVLGRLLDAKRRRHGRDV